MSSTTSASTTPTSNADTVKTFYGYLHSGDLDGAATLMTDDFSVDESVELQFGGVYHGRAGLGELLAKIHAQLEGAPVGEAEYLELGADRVTVLMQTRWTSRKTGRSFSERIVEILTLRDGLIAKLDIYYKQPAAVAALED
jgi:ketosteroid isomerase-like protein